MYKVIVCASRMPIPIQMFVHTWIVTEYNENVNRFDVFGFKIDQGERVGYVYKNYNPPFLGCPVFSIGKYRFLKSKFRWKTETIFSIQGANDSDAQKIHDLLNQDYKKLLFAENYRLLLGPNSNSFTQWVLDKVAPSKYKLPRKAYGRGWKEKV